MQTVRITTSQNIDIDYEVAGFGERLLARLIDVGILVVLLILGTIIGASTPEGFRSTVTIIILVSVYLAVFVFYDLACEVFMNGQSIGKRIMKIKVISLDGARPSLGQYMLRWLFRIVDFTLSSQLCAIISVLVSEKHQRVGDMVAGTTLIKTQPRTLLNNLVFRPVEDEYTPVFYEATQLSDRDITLIQEVVRNYFQTGNTVVVYSTAAKIKELLSIKPLDGMDDLLFLQTVVKDYTHLITLSDLPTNS
ncbi:RDD family protein [Mucilaginibacter sp. X4EP1]|uniref:RDD family protein n=1 Tax=Mucilaginibacter sp. X4EP1 TaxID=2723092 RepID=UPI002168C191|nr:RDD family protein [Mucilaginibacter sp. X4EP1]MCS3813942.1 putative RDD family membrane protein YckC [Mucilaginibacter sp. X4EP1]